MIGSHNTLSYLKPVKWWQKLLNPWTKCQLIDILTQKEIGVRYFDIRIRPVMVDGKYVPHYCHNNVDYGKTDERVFMVINHWSLDLKIYLRITLDVREKPEDADEMQTWFLNYIQYLKNKYPHINFDSIKVFWDWSNDYGPQEIKVIEFHWSVNKKRWYEYLFPIKLYAQLNNSKIRSSLAEEVSDSNNDVAVMYDFVELNYKMKK